MNEHRTTRLPNSQGTQEMPFERVAGWSTLTRMSTPSGTPSKRGTPQHISVHTCETPSSTITVFIKKFRSQTVARSFDHSSGWSLDCQPIHKLHFLCTVPNPALLPDVSKYPSLVAPRPNVSASTKRFKGKTNTSLGSGETRRGYTYKSNTVPELAARKRLSRILELLYLTALIQFIQENFPHHLRTLFVKSTYFSTSPKRRRKP